MQCWWHLEQAERVSLVKLNTRPCTIHTVLEGERLMDADPDDKAQSDNHGGHGNAQDLSGQVHGVQRILRVLKIGRLARGSRDNGLRHDGLESGIGHGHGHRDASRRARNEWSRRPNNAMVRKRRRMPIRTAFTAISLSLSWLALPSRLNPCGLLAAPSSPQEKNRKSKESNPAACVCLCLCASRPRSELNCSLLWTRIDSGGAYWASICIGLTTP